jgi:four helix bundle protein
MARPKSYRDLIVWPKTMALARTACWSAESLSRRETYCLVDPIRRAAVSVASNIAEGRGRLTDLQSKHFLGNACGSLCELRIQLELATDLEYFDKETGERLMEQSAEVAPISNGLIASLSTASKSGGKTNSANSANPASSARYV